MATPKPKHSIELEPGNYIVTVLHDRYRLWRIGHDGTITGHGSKLKRTAVWYALSALTLEAEHREGIDPSRLGG